MSVCQTTPTATQFATVTTDSVSTSSSASVTTVPASVTTITTSSCSAVSSGVSAGCETTTIVSTISPEQVVTTQVPVDVTVPVTLTSATATLFGTSCTTTGGGGGGGVISTPPPSSTSSSTSSSISTLPPSTSQTVIQSSSTLPGGSVVVVSSTLTTVVTPTTLVPVTNNNRSSSSNVGAIVGGTVGGVAFLAILFLAIFFCIRKRHKDRDDDFDHVDGKINPFPIRLHRNNKKAQNMTIDEPDPFNTNGPSNFSANPAPEANLAGVGAGAAGIGAASAVGAASNGPQRTPSATTGSFPNPYSAAPSSVDEPQRNGPPGPMSDGSVVSESIYSQQSRFPQALHVANPSEYPPIGNVQQSRQPSMPMPVPEVSDPSAYGNSSDGGASTAQAGTSFAPYVHQDAGRAEPGRRTKAAEARRDAEEEPGHVFPPPPAYEE